MDFFWRELENLAAFSQIRLLSQDHVGSPEFQMDAPHRAIVRSIPKIPAGAEGLFDAQPVVLEILPALLGFRQEFALANGQHLCLVVHVVAVLFEEAKQQFPQSLMIVLPPTP